MAGTICPQYCYFNGGSFWLYYTLHAPGCYGPFSWSGPPGLTPPGRNCMTGSDCFDPAMKVGGGGAGSLGEHFHQDLVTKGMGEYPQNATLQPGACVCDPAHGTRVEYVRFYRDPGDPNEECVARVFRLRVRPKNFHMPEGDPTKLKENAPIEDYFGCEVAPNTVGEIDCDVKRGEVKTVERVGHCARIEVQIQGKPQEYDILLKHRCNL